MPADSPFETVDDLVAGLEGRPRLGHHRRRLVARRPRPPVPDAAGPGGRHRPARGQLRLLRRRRPAHHARCSARRSTSAPPASASSRARSRTGSLRVLAVSGEERLDDRRRAHADRGGHRPGLHQLARRARPARHQRRAARLPHRDLHRDARHRRVARRARAQRLDRQLRHRRRVRRRSSTSRTTASPTPSRSWDWHEHRPTTTDRRRAPAPTRLVDKAQYGLAAFLVVVGGYVLYDATTLDDGLRRPARAALRLLLRRRRRARRARRAARRRHRARRPARGRGRRGRRPRRRQPTGAPSACSSASSSLNIAADRLAGLGDHRRAALRRRRLRAGQPHAACATSRSARALSVGTWYGFYVGLGIPIPAGILDGIL